MSATVKKWLLIAIAVIVALWLIGVLWLTIGGIHPAKAATHRHIVKGITSQPIKGKPKPDLVARAAATYGPFKGSCWSAPFGSRFNDLSGLRLVSVYRRYHWCKDGKKVWAVRRGGLVVDASRWSFLWSVEWKAVSVDSGYRWLRRFLGLGRYGPARRHYFEYIRVHGEQCLPIIKTLLCKGHTTWSDVDLRPDRWVTVFHRRL
jgi:hypothetical protein